MAVIAYQDPKLQTIRIVTWNIGLKALKNTVKDVSSGSLARLLVLLKADILCLQETKIAHIGELTDTIALAPGYTSYFHCNRKHDAYAGVATIVRDGIPVKAVHEGITGSLQYRQSNTAESPEVATPSTVAEIDECSVDKEAGVSGGRVIESGFGPLSSPISQPSAQNSTSATTIPALELDSEGRCIITDHGGFVLINCYVPALTSSDSYRYDFKLAFHEAIRQRVLQLQNAGKQVILVGDINVTHRRMDHCDPDVHVKEHQLVCFEETPFRRWMTCMLSDTNIAGWQQKLTKSHTIDDKTSSPHHLVDSFRVYHPEREGAFTCWSIVTSARATNYGTRLDYILVDSKIANGSCESIKLVSSDIDQSFLGSDHCPVYAEFEVPEGWGRLVDSGATLSTAKPNVTATAYSASLNGCPAFAKRQVSVKTFFDAKAAATTALPVHPAENASFIKPVASATKAARPVQMRLTSVFATKAKVVSVVPAAFASFGHHPVSDTTVDLCDSDSSVDKQVPEPAPAQSASTSQAWAKLLTGKLPPPPCRCGVISVERTVKEGKNLGKVFYVCSKPAGKAGDVNARCDFFMWLDAWREVKQRSDDAAGEKRLRPGELNLAQPTDTTKRSRVSYT